MLYYHKNIEFDQESLRYSFESSAFKLPHKISGHWIFEKFCPVLPKLVWPVSKSIEKIMKNFL